jgi:hypothetical protein
MRNGIYGMRYVNLEKDFRIPEMLIKNECYLVLRTFHSEMRKRKLKKQMSVRGLLGFWTSPVLKRCALLNIGG